MMGAPVTTRLLLGLTPGRQKATLADLLSFREARWP